jgi:microcystin-dependent protein
MEPFIGQVCMFGFSFPPRGWATCDGQLLPIAQNTALFSLLGITYGGDGKTTFGLPDLRGRAAVGDGNGPGLNPIANGQRGGHQITTLTANNLPSHTHSATLHAESALGNSANPNGKMLAGVQNMYAAPDPADNKTLASDSIVVNSTGGSTPFDNLDPYLGMNYCIALVGIFPSRS